jgi:hypothetical protein
MQVRAGGLAQSTNAVAVHDFAKHANLASFAEPFRKLQLVRRSDNDVNLLVVKLSGHAQGTVAVLNSLVPYPCSCRDVIVGDSPSIE